MEQSLSASEPAPANRFALAFIFVTMLVDTIGLGIIIPVTPAIIKQLTGQELSGAAGWGCRAPHPMAAS